MTAMELGLAHSLSRYKLKFSPDKIDTMIVQVMISKYPSRWFLSNESPQSEYYFLYWSEVWGRIIGNPYLLVMVMINQEVILIQMKEDFNIGVIPYLPFLYIIFVGCQFAGRFGQRAKQLHYEM